MAGGAGQVEQADLDLDLGPERVVSCAEVLMYVSLDSLHLPFILCCRHTDSAPNWATTRRSSNAIARNLPRKEMRPPPREEDPPSREPTPPPAVATLVGVYVVRLQRTKATDQDRRRPVGEVGLASTATAIATEVLMTATDVGMTTPLEIGAIEEDDAIRETGVGVRLVIGEDTTTTTTSMTGGGNRPLELLTTAVRTTAGRGADRGVLLLLLLLMRGGEATTAIAMSQDEEEEAVMAIVTGEGETTHRRKERETISVAGSISSRLKQIWFSCNSAHCVAPYGL